MVLSGGDGGGDGGRDSPDGDRSLSKFYRVAFPMYYLSSFFNKGKGGGDGGDEMQHSFYGGPHPSLKDAMST
jgi:hypothetical protein